MLNWDLIGYRLLSSMQFHVNKLCVHPIPKTIPFHPLSKNMFLEHSRLLLFVISNRKKRPFFCFDCEVFSYSEEGVLIYATFVMQEVVTNAEFSLSWSLAVYFTSRTMLTLIRIQTESSSRTSSLVTSSFE